MRNQFDTEVQELKRTEISRIGRAEFENHMLKDELDLTESVNSDQKKKLNQLTAEKEKFAEILINLQNKWTLELAEVSKYLHIIHMINYFSTTSKLIKLKCMGTVTSLQKCKSAKTLKRL